MEQEGASIFIYCPQIDINSIIQLWPNSITTLLEGKVDLDGKKRSLGLYLACKEVCTDKTITKIRKYGLCGRIVYEKIYEYLYLNQPLLAGRIQEKRIPLAEVEFNLEKLRKKLYGINKNLFVRRTDGTYKFVGVGQDFYDFDSNLITALLSNAIKN